MIVTGSAKFEEKTTYAPEPVEAYLSLDQSLGGSADNQNITWADTSWVTRDHNMVSRGGKLQP